MKHKLTLKQTHRLPSGDIQAVYEGDGVYVAATIERAQIVYFTAYFDRYTYCDGVVFSGELRGMAPLKEWRQLLNEYSRR